MRRSRSSRPALVGLVAGAALVACGPGAHAPATGGGLDDAPELGPVPPPNACDLPRVFPACSWANCGMNSSYLTGSAVDPLHLDGCRNRDEVRLVPGTVRAASDRCGPRRLRFELGGGGLIARDVTGRSTCAGEDLIGATFWIEGPPGRLPLSAGGLPAVGDRRFRFIRQQLRIARVGAAAGLDGVSRPTYVIEPTGGLLIPDGERWAAHDVSDRLPGRAGARHLCVHADRWMGPWSGTSTIGRPRRPAAEASADQQLLIAAGEVYDGTGSVIAADQPRWFHLACAGSALAKTRLDGADPGRDGATADQRAARLKMLMAYYCARGQRAYTEPGVNVFMDAAPETPAGRVAREREPRVGAIEARWTAHGASCLSHSRLWRAGSPLPAWVPALRRVAWMFGRWVELDPIGESETAFVARIRTLCNIPACASRSARADEHWTTYTVDHARHPLLSRPRDLPARPRLPVAPPSP